MNHLVEDIKQASPSGISSQRLGLGLYIARAVASMGQGAAIVPSPKLSAYPPPPDGLCPDHGRKPAFGNKAIVSLDFIKTTNSVKIYLFF